MSFAQLTKSWELSSELHSFTPPANEQDLQIVEEKLGIRLPSSLRDLYKYSNGIYLLEGNLSIYPLIGNDHNLGLTNASVKLREWHWAIPEEVLIFGNNGSDDQFGLWYPETNNRVYNFPIIAFGEIFEGPNMAIMATNLLSFLFGWTCYYLMLLEVDSEALDVLNLPEELRFGGNELEEGHFVQIRRWSDPTLPEPAPDPYERGLTPEDLRELLGKLPD